jgi:hypothetical protein
MRIFALSTALFLGLSPVAQAATLNEADLVGGFNSNFATPTDIAFGNSQVNGTLAAGDFDFIRFTSLAAGAQSLNFTFALNNPSAGAPVQNAGGEVRVSETQPASEFDGTRVNPTAGPSDFVLSYNLSFPLANVLTQTLSYNLSSGFAGGDLYVSILPTFASATAQFSFGIAAPGNATPPAPVPIPAAGLLLFAALAGFAALRRRTSLGLIAPA